MVRVSFCRWSTQEPVDRQQVRRSDLAENHLKYILDRDNRKHSLSSLHWVVNLSGFDAQSYRDRAQ